MSSSFLIFLVIPRGHFRTAEPRGARLSTRVNGRRFVSVSARDEQTFKNFRKKGREFSSSP